MHKLATLSVFLLLLSLTPTATAQNLMVTPVAGAPIEIADVKSADPENWARTLTLSIRNSGTKRIGLVEYRLELPDLVEDGRVVSVIFRYGNPDDDDPKLLKPGDSTKISLIKESAKQLDRLLYGGRSPVVISAGGSMSNTRTQKLSPKVRLTKGTLSVTRVIFEDGTVWPK